MYHWKQSILENEKSEQTKNILERRHFNRTLIAGGSNLKIYVVESRQETRDKRRRLSLSFNDIKTVIRNNMDRYHWQHIYKKEGRNKQTYDKAYQRWQTGKLTKPQFEKIVQKFRRKKNLVIDEPITDSSAYFVGGIMDGKNENNIFLKSHDDKFSIQINGKTIQAPYQCRIKHNTRQTRKGTSFESKIGARYNLAELNRATTIVYAISNDVLVGYAFGRYETRRRRFYLSLLCSSHRAGAKVLKHIEKYLKRKNVSILYLRAAHTNGDTFEGNVLRKWYKKMGYVSRPDPCKGDLGAMYTQKDELNKKQEVYDTTAFDTLEESFERNEITRKTFEREKTKLSNQMRSLANKNGRSKPYDGKPITNEDGWLMSKCLRKNACTTVRGEEGKIEVYSRCRTKLNQRGKCTTTRYEEPRCVPVDGWGGARKKTKERTRGKYSKLSTREINKRRRLFPAPQ